VRSHGGVFGRRDGKGDKEVSDNVKKITCAATGEADYNKAVAFMKQDGAAVKVASMCGLEEEVCQLHDGNHIGRSGLGDKTWSKSKKPLDPFPEAQTTLAKLDKGTEMFKWKSRVLALYAKCACHAHAHAHAHAHCAAHAPGVCPACPMPPVPPSL